MTEAPVTPTRRCIQIGILVGLAAALYGFLEPIGPTDKLDFHQTWFATRAVAAGEDPYALIGPGRPYQWRWPLYYPLTAAVVVAPLAPLPARAAYYTWIGLTSGLLAFALMRYRGQAALWILCSGAMVRSVALGQWAPLLTAAYLWPVLRFVFTAKPTVGVGLFAASPTRIPRATILVGVFIILASFGVFPDWWIEWLAAVQSADHFTAPIARTTVGAIVIPLALTRWRRPEARLVFAMACVPQTPAIYETLPVLLAARRWQEYLGMTVLSSLAEMWISIAPGNTTAARWARAVPTIVYMAYLPAVVLILSRRNEGTLPAWLERRLTVLPTWLRGSVPA